MKTLNLSFRHCIYMMVCIVVSLMASRALAQSENITRGIGLYPGDPNEYFAPSSDYTLGDDSVACYNVALHRAA